MPRLIRLLLLTSVTLWLIDQPTYQAKWANALLASAILIVSRAWSWPRPRGGRRPSARRRAGGTSAGRLFARMAPRIQRIARLCWRFVDLHRHLVGGPADALGADLDRSA